MAVLFDIQGTQSPSDGDRGIGRYLSELSSALLALPSRQVTTFVLDPTLPLPSSVESLKGSGRLTFQDRLQAAGDEIYHIGSPLDCQVPLDRLLPPLVRSRRLRLTVTLFDLIPFLYPDDYLAYARNRSRYNIRLELVRQATRVLTISQSAADDAVDILGLDPDRVSIVGTGVSERFKPPPSRADAVSVARHAITHLRERYILVACAGDPRKNIERMVDAYATLPSELQLQHQLVVVGRLGLRDQSTLEKRAKALGCYEPILFPGHVPDDLLVRLYQGCEIFVFPSLYEGFGLPAAEARACGAPTLVADSSSLVEIVPDEQARFDPHDPHKIRDAIQAALSNPERLERIRPQRNDPSWSWKTVAERTEQVFDELVSRRGRRPRRTAVAFVSPLPPQRSGVADYSARLLAELTLRRDVDVFVTPPVRPDASAQGAHAYRAETFELADRLQGGYADIVYCLGNSEHHLTTLALLRRRSGVVMAHDVRLAELYQAAVWSDSNETRHFGEIVRSMYDEQRFDGIPENGMCTFEAFDRASLYMAREAIACSERFLVHSEYAAQLARLEAPSGMEWKIEVLPFAAPPPREGKRRTLSNPVVATFGHAHPIKQHPKIVEAFRIVLDQHPDAVLGVVGPIYPELERQLTRQADELGFRDHLVITGGLDESHYREWLEDTSVAVQLRAASNGESSASVHDCLSAGIPTVVTAIGSGGELPDTTAVKVEREITALDLGLTISRLLADPARCHALGEAGLEYARAHSFARVAEELLEVIDSSRASRILAA